MRDLRKVVRFYDALMASLGLRRVRACAGSREYYATDRGDPFFGVIQAVTSVPGRTRIAFAAATRKDVDRVAAAVKRAGARKMSGPEVCAAYHQPYYAVFFEDPDGNRFEVCCRR